MLGATAFALTLAAAAPARAQDTDAGDQTIASELATVRVSLLGQRRAFGIALGVAGLSSTLAGGVTLAAGYEDPAALGAALGLGVWGLVNAVASLFMVDLDDDGLRAAASGRALRGEALARERERTLRAQHDQAAIWALNTGLDVFYVASGILLFFVADLLDSPEAQDGLRGYAAAQMGQGGFLLAFDLIGWIFAAANADRVAAIPMPSR